MQVYHKRVWHFPPPRAVNGREEIDPFFHSLVVSRLGTTDFFILLTICFTLPKNVILQIGTVYYVGTVVFAVLAIIKVVHII